jgi:hypothetical protein
MYIFFFRCRCRANRTAIDSAADYTDKEFAVKSRIARQPRSRTDLPIQSHFCPELMIVEPAGSIGRFRTMFPNTIPFPKILARRRA